MDIKERFFTQSVKRFPREVVTAPRLTEFMKCLGSPLKHMILGVWPVQGQKLGFDDPCGSLPTRIF